LQGCGNRADARLASRWRTASSWSSTRTGGPSGWGRPWAGWRAATDQDVDDVRLALAEFVESGHAHMQRDQEPADAERLEAHRRFCLVMDWERAPRRHARAGLGLPLPTPRLAAGPLTAGG
jgi:hypothetical protein